MQSSSCSSRFHHVSAAPLRATTDNWPSVRGMGLGAGNELAAAVISFSQPEKSSFGHLRSDRHDSVCGHITCRGLWEQACEELS